MDNDLQITTSTMVEGTRKWDWLQARTAYVPGANSMGVTTMNQTLNRFVHDYGDIYQTITRDDGGSWSTPTPVSSLRRIKTRDNYEIAPSDMWTQFHRVSGKIIATGVTFHFQSGNHEHHLKQQIGYSVMDPNNEFWGPLRILNLPERDHADLPMLSQSAGCSQRVDLPGGDILLPLRYLPSSTLDPLADTFDYSDESVLYKSIVARCRFDGTTLKYKEHGTEHSITREHSHRLAKRRAAEFSARGLSEPSLIWFNGQFFLTLRSDHSAFVTKGDDGIHFNEAKEWKFDNGDILGNYCTQQHWATIGGRLYLLYNRPTDNNNHVFRHRAPIFIALVDPISLQIIRESERVAISEDNAAMGNFGICEINGNETWVTCGEGKRSHNRKGDTNRVMLSRIRAV